MSDQGAPTAESTGEAHWITIAFAAVLLGLVVGFIACFLILVAPLQSQLESREKSLREWERLNRVEREAIADIKALSVEEIKQWVIRVDEHAKQYAELQLLIHRRDQQLTNQPFWYVLIAVVLVLIVFGGLFFNSRDLNADAARTMETAVRILPVLLEGQEERRNVKLLSGSGKEVSTVDLPDPERNT